MFLRQQLKRSGNAANKRPGYQKPLPATNTDGASFASYVWIFLCRTQVSHSGCHRRRRSHRHRPLQRAQCGRVEIAHQP